MDVSSTQVKSSVNKHFSASASAAMAISGTVFHQPWWLEAASGGDWKEATVISHGAVIARLPYVTKRIMGISGIGMPPLTHLLGPQLPIDPSGSQFRFPERRALCADLIGQLPPHRYFSQICDPSITDALPLYALGYKSELKYTLRIPPMASPDDILEGMRPRIRSAVRKAEKMFSVDLNIEIDEFCHFYNTCTQANNKLWWSRRFEREADALKARLFAACVKENAGRLLAARDHTGILRAVVMLVWSNGVMYYFLTAHDSQPQGSGSVKLLIWESLKLARELGMVFDFDGLPRPDAVNILSGFGGTVANRIEVTKIPPPLYLAREIASRLRFGL